MHTIISEPISVATLSGAVHGYLQSLQANAGIVTEHYQ
jgi:hypothetical protein